MSPGRRRRSARSARVGAAALGVAWLTVAGLAHAVDPADLPSRSGGHHRTVTAGTGARHEHWVGSGRRPFVAAVFDVGIINVRPELELGYGEPHHRWFGLEGYSELAVGGGTDYVGLRGATPYLDFRMGLRYEFPTSQRFLSPKDSYTREDTELDFNGRSHYLALDTEIDASIPMPGGRLLAVASAYGVLGTPRELFVFEEALQIVIDPPFLWRGRLGYLATVNLPNRDDDAMRIGGAVEVIHNPSREHVVVRAGPLMSVALTCHLEAVAGAMLVAASRDSLGLTGADFGNIGLVYRWATGEVDPSFP